MGMVDEIGGMTPKYGSIIVLTSKSKGSLALFFANSSNYSEGLILIS